MADSKEERSILRVVRVRPPNDSEAGQSFIVNIEREVDSKTSTKSGRAVRVGPPSGTTTVQEVDAAYWSANGFIRSSDTGFYEADVVNRGSYPHQYASQDAIFSDLVAPMINNACDHGISCMVLSYGAAKSGKAFSVIGKKPNRGLLPAAIANMARRVEQSKKEGEFGRKHKVYLSMYQICDEKIYDMQSVDSQGREVTKHFVEGLTFTRIATESDGLVALDTACKNSNRARGPLLPFTHSVFTITIDTTISTTSPPTLNTAHVHFVVTADTDQVNNTVMPNEARTLQRSLRALGGVLGAYAHPSSSSVAPFEESCLTRTLRGYFEDRRWRTIVLAAVSPAASSLAVTTDTLSFLALKPVLPSSPVATEAASGIESAAAEEEKKLGLQKRRPVSSSDPDVLLVEDVPVSKRVAQVSMQRASYKVEAASDGESAVELFKTHWPTLKIVLMDIGLPKMSGVEATRQIRAFEANQADKSPVIILGLTANMESENLEEYREAGMNGCIMKGSLVADAVNGALKQLENEPRKFVTLVLGGSGATPSPGKPKGEGKSIKKPKRPDNFAHDSGPVEVDRDDDKALLGVKNAAPPAKATPPPPAAITTPTAAPAVIPVDVKSQQAAAAAAAANANAASAAHPRGGAAAMALLNRRSGGHTGAVRPGIGLPSARREAQQSDTISTAMSSQSALLRAAISDTRPAAVVKPDLKIPVSSISADTRAAEGPLSPPHSARPLEVLLVEDIKVSQKAAEKALQRLGYKVAVASDGESAVAQYRNNMSGFGLVLMDIGLPGISGIEAAQQIRAMERERGHAPVRMFGLTGNVEEENLASYEEVGMNGCILKGTTLGEAVRIATEQLAADPTRFIKLSKKEIEAASGGGGDDAPKKSRGKTAVKD